MKKTLLIVVLMLIVSFSFAQIYTIGSGTAGSYTTPVNGLYNYSWSKTIYTVPELNSVGLTNPAVITAVGFNVSNTPASYTFLNQQIYLRNTNLTVQDNSAPVVSNYVQVYNDNVTFNGSGWFTVQFTTPFQWDGAGNIEVVWINNDGAWVSGYPNFYYTQTATYLAAYAQSDASLPTGAGTITYNRPDIQIHATQEFPDEPTLFTYPTSIDFGDVRFGQTSDPVNITASNYGQGTLHLTAANISITGTHADLFDFNASALPAALDMAENVQIPVTVTGSVAGAVSATLTITYGGEDHDIPLSANVLPQGTIDIGDGTATQRFPFGHLYGYERSAAVYTMDDIGAVGLIHSIGWHCSAGGTVPIPYKIYIGTTDSNQVPSQSFQTLTAGMTLVKQGNYTFNNTGWHTFNLDTPVVYTGGNMLVAVENNYGGSGTSGYPYFYYTTSGQNSHAYWQQDNSMPTAGGNLNTLRPNLRLMLGDLTGDPQLSVSPQVINYGTVFNNTQIGPRNITLANIGGGSLTVNPGDITISGTHAAQFSFDASNLPAILESAETITIPVYVTGTTTGDISAMITVNHPSGIHNVELLANVLPPGIAIVGDGTATQRQPFGHVWGYERSAAVYTAQEIGGVGMLHQVGWYCQSGSGSSIPYKIYVGTTTQTVLTAMTFQQLTADMMLVKEGSHHFTETGWTLFQLDMPIPYVGDNLVIAVETNYGGSGGGTSPYFQYSIGATGSHMYWYQDSSQPTGNGNLNTYRPNLMIALGELGGDPQLVSFPDALNFGEVANGIASQPKFMTVANIGGGTITLTENDVSITGTNAAVFSYDDSVFPIVLDSASSFQIPLYAMGTQPGTFTANFNVAWGGETFTTTMSATILPPGLLIIGDGTTDLKLPVNPFYGYSYTQQLYLQSEINMPDKQIEQIAFYWNGAGVGTLTKDWVIWMGHTSQTSLSSYLPINNMLQVFDGEVLASASPGWITIDLDIPFVYNNVDNLVIAVDENTPSYDGSAQFYYCTNTTTSRALRFYSDGENPNPSAPPTPTVLQGYPNIRMLLFDIPDSPMVTYNPYELDFGVVSYDVEVGPLYVNVGNRGIGTLTLNATDISITGEHASMFSFDDSGFPLNLQTGVFAQIPVYVQSTQEGPINANFVITYEGEEFMTQLSASTMEQGLLVLQLGNGTNVNGDTSNPAPYGSWYRCFREQYLFKADEIFALGGAPGLINSIGWDVSEVGSCSAMPNYRIRLKHTSQQALTSSFETGAYTEVFQAASYMPTAGWNLHIFSEPFIWNGQDNLLVDIVTDQTPGSYTRNAICFNTATTFASTLRYQSDSGNGLDGTSGSTVSSRPNTRLFMIIDGMGSLNGNITEDGLPLKNVTVSIQGSVFTALTNNNGYYSFPFAPVGTQTVVASKHGYTSVSHTVEIVEDETSTQDFIMVGTPEFSFSDPDWHFGDVTIGGSSNKDFIVSNAGGSTLTVSSIQISGSGAFTMTQLPTLPITLRSEDFFTLRVNFAPALLGELEATITIVDDQNNRYVATRSSGGRLSVANQGRESRESHEISIFGNGVHSISIGDGSQNALIPLNFYWKNSIFQTIFTSTDLDGFIGMITGIKLYNNFYSSLTNKPVKIWLAATTQTDLSAGWISSNNMTLVFDGNVNFPSGENTISINFPDPFLFIEGGNLVMLFNRPMDTEYHSSSDYFLCQTLGSTRSRNDYSDSTDFNPASMDGGTLSGQFPKITFEVIPGGVGHIEGIVRGEDGTPLPGVNVSLDLRVNAITNQYGEFHLMNILPNDYALTLSRYGYLTQTVNVTVEEDVTEELDITMEEMPKVSILGTIIASDTGDGIEGATLSFTGYADYTVATNLAGDFIVDASVYAYNTYDYVITATGYTTRTGSIEVGPQDYNMGTISMNELAFAPTQVVATLSPDYSTVNIAWNPPDPDAFEINESFEDVVFPPDTWTQTITNNGVPNMHGVRPTWCRFSVAEGVTPTEGGYQAGLAWVAEHQDEWLFTPGFTCPPDAYVKFDTHLNMGSEGGDHYYVKISLDEGANWQVLWDGAAQPEGMNNYATPIVIDLTPYAGLTVKLAWHADDGVDAFGMWYNWYIDNVYIGNFQRTEQLSTLANLGSAISAKDTSEAVKITRGVSIAETNAKLALKANNGKHRGLIGYRVWRLRTGQEEAENNWVLITDEMLTETGFEDTNWSSLAQGDYLWAIRAVYTSDVMSVPVFSNSLTKQNTNGTISGSVRSSVGNIAIAGATVSAGQFSATTMASGFYNLSLPAGTYTVTATHPNFTQVSHEDIVVVFGENTTLNFIMTPTSNEDVVEITVTALNSNYPNPFNPETTISYDIKEPGKVRLDVFNLKGQLVRTLVNDEHSTGRYN
ncbi:MAG: carboxypeptidase regulatory-like domain-containing protein, partial [Candidatus Cloacimonetes bacterium]|nr:carboxypeptidase regulatory-like domain-containing protein [Candidatus Cloacimonadota bacterium]